MSSTAAHESKMARRACQICQERKARFRFRGAVRADRDHVLCFECYRAERNRQRRQRADGPAALPFLRPASGHAAAAGDRARPPAAQSQAGWETTSPRQEALTDAAIEHRRRMLSHLSGARRTAAGTQP